MRSAGQSSEEPAKDPGRRTTLPRGAWLDHEPSWLEAAEADAVLATLRDELAWEQRAIVLFGRSVLQPRLIAWAGALAYRYSGQTLDPRPFTPTLGRLLEEVRDRAGVPFNHVLANRYRDGRDSMGLHADDEAELGEDPVVATVSLGTTRRFVVKARRKADASGVALDLEHGSLVVMGGACQRHYVHGVPRQAQVRDERISLTFRRLLRAPAGELGGSTT
jgi:alkylated DNA repair dioxygenase AlkB